MAASQPMLCHNPGLFVQSGKKDFREGPLSLAPLMQSFSIDTVTDGNCLTCKHTIHLLTSLQPQSNVPWATNGHSTMAPSVAATLKTSLGLVRSLTTGTLWKPADQEHMLNAQGIDPTTHAQLTKEVSRALIFLWGKRCV